MSTEACVFTGIRGKKSSFVICADKNKTEAFQQAVDNLRKKVEFQFTCIVSVHLDINTMSEM